MISSDKSLWCIKCGGFRPHRWRPSPEAGPFWRCSECGEALSEDGDSEQTVTVNALHEENRAKDATIKALADALLSTRRIDMVIWCWCHPARDLCAAGHSEACNEAMAAVRRAGRLP